MKFFSLCAGKQVRFTKVYFPPKPTIVIGDEMLIGRVTRQLKERGYPLSVVARDVYLLGLSEKFGFKYFTPTARRWTIESFLSTREEWKGRTTILLGDVFYTEETLDRIIDSQAPIAFFGDAQEVYAITFDRRSVMKRLLARTILDAEAGKCKGTLRNLYSNMTGTPYGEGIHKSKKLWFDVSDKTCDFDLPRDMGKAKRRTDLIEKGRLK